MTLEERLAEIRNKPRDRRGSIETESTIRLEILEAKVDHLLEQVGAIQELHRIEATWRNLDPDFRKALMGMGPDTVEGILAKVASRKDA